jgi:ribosomal protein S6--L-glutamate ligase
MNIVVLSRNPGLYSTQSIVQACRRRRHEVMVLDHQRFDLVLESGELSLYYNMVKITGVDAIIPRIGATATSYGAMVVRQFELMGVFTVTQSEALIRARDKFKCMQYLVHHGVPVPKTLMLNMVDLKSQFIKDHLDPPIVVKMKESTHGMGVVLSHDHNNAQSIAEAFNKLDQETIIQEFISESKGQDVRAFVVNGEVVGAMRREAAEGDFRSNLHRGGKSYIESLSRDEEKIVLQAARVLGLKVAGVDLLRSNRGPLILEVNASPGLEGIETTTRQDISGKIINFIERYAPRMKR